MMFSAVLEPAPDPMRSPARCFLQGAGGIPVAGAGHIECSLDLNDLLKTGKPSDCYLRLDGVSMILAGRHRGDYLVVDRALTPVHNNIVIAVLDGELTVKCLWPHGAQVELHPPILPSR